MSEHPIYPDPDNDPEFVKDLSLYLRERWKNDLLPCEVAADFLATRLRTMFTEKDISQHILGAKQGAVLLGRIRANVSTPALKDGLFEMATSISYLVLEVERGLFGKKKASTK